MWSCEVPEQGSKLVLKEADPQQMEGAGTITEGNNFEGKEIAVVLSDSLVKYPEHGSGENSVVLEKAHVAIRN